MLIGEESHQESMKVLNAVDDPGVHAFLVLAGYAFIYYYGYSRPCQFQFKGSIQVAC